MTTLAAVLVCALLGALAVFQALLASRSTPERAVMSPFAAVLCGLCVVVAAG